VVTWTPQCLDLYGTMHGTATGTAFDPESGRLFFAGEGSTFLRYPVNVHTGEIHTFGAPVTWPEGNEHGWQFSY
jgi:hypothetical protein